jgi:hypothetical protein
LWFGLFSERIADTGDRLSNPLRSDAPPHFHSPSNSGSPAISASIRRRGRCGMLKVAIGAV